MRVTTRVVVFSDVHGNRAALDAVIEHIATLNPDHVVCGGDLAFGGPDPQGTVARIMAMGIPCVRGNTDEWLVPDAAEREPVAVWTRGRLSLTSREYLNALPFEHRLDGLLVVHATPWSVSDIVPRDAGVTQLRRLLDEGRAETVVYGHIHVGWIGRLPDGRLVVNSGSVGFPFDGDPRASCALLERTTAGWSAALHRIPYDVDRAAAGFPSDHPSPAAWAARIRTGRRG